MARKRLLENTPSASSSSSSSSSSGEEDKELPRKDNTVDSASASDSETESDNNVSAFEVMPIIPISAMRSDPKPERSGDAKVIASAADETPKKKKKKLKAEKGKHPVLSKKPNQKSSDLSKNANNDFAHTDAADVEMAEPSDEPSDDPPFHITLALPYKRALHKKSKVNKSGNEKEDPVGDKVVAVRERLQGKKKATAKWAENEEYPVGDKVVAVSERTKGKKKVVAKAAEKKNLLDNKIESLSEGLKGEVVGDKNEQYLSLIGDGTGAWWEDLSKIESDKAEELKKKWKELKVEGLELLILKKELLKEIAIAVSDALKASRS